MSLNAALSLLIDEYPSAAEQEFSNNSVAEFIRKDLPTVIRQILPSGERYLVHGSAGTGNWARVPWVAVFDRLITETAQDGYYIVYLAREDFDGVYLSLNQGVTFAKNVYGSGAKEALRVRAADFLARLGKLPSSYTKGSIDLGVGNSTSLGAYYEQGSICARYYAKDAIPTDDELEADLVHFLGLYFLLATKDLLPVSDALEDDEKGLGEQDLRTLREHKRIERNRKLSAQAKKVHGYVCQACTFSFEERYGAIGREYIEAHHLTPLHRLQGQKVALDLKIDFAVLCSNCHRMIHKTTLVSQVNEFKAQYIVGEHSVR